MEGRQMAMGGRNPLAMQVAADEPVWTSASVAALGGRAPTGVCGILRANAPGDGQHWPQNATRSYLARYPRPEQSLTPGRRELQQIQVRNSPAKGGSSITATALVARSPYANRSRHAHHQITTVPVNAHSHTTRIHSITVRHSPTSIRQPTPTPVQSLATNTDAARLKTRILSTNPHQVPFLDEEQHLRGATRAERGESRSMKAPQPVEFLQGLYQFR